MRRQFQNGNYNVTDNLNGSSTMHNGSSQFVNHNPRNLFQPGSSENEDYRMMYKHQLENVSPISSFINTCYLGFIQSESTDNIGPIIVNISQDEGDKSIQMVDLDLDFLDEDKYISQNVGQMRIIKKIQERLESFINRNQILSIKESKKSFKNVTEFFKSGTIRFKMTPLPFDHLFLNSVKTRVASVDSESQTIKIIEKEHKTEEDLINVLKEQIQVLKDQNQLLRKQLDISVRHGSSRPTKEYVIRKYSQSTVKSTRNNSAASTDIVIENESIKSEKTEPNRKALTNLTLLTNENSSLQEMLQEYMLENEALRQQNHSLEEVRASHNAELYMINKRNKDLLLKVEELNKKVSVDNSLDHLRIDLSENIKTKNDATKEYRGYPIMYDKSVPTNSKSSYLQQFDILKEKLQNETSKRATSIPRNAKNLESNPEKPLENGSKWRPGRNLINDTLLEELSRIDVTIREHIRKNQFNDTLRNMGKKQSPRKN